MKFLSSSASSTITTTTTTAAAATTPFDGNNVNSSKSATAGCIAGVFRRLLCLNSLPTYPSDDHFRDIEYEITYSSSVEFDIKTGVKVEGPASTPNIVARLMGLESLPQIDLLSEQKGSNSSAISRSRSMNYVDTVLKELEYSSQGKHRRVKSFRETPTFLDLEDENFLILSFENGAERMKLAPKGKKSAAEKTKNKNKKREHSSVGRGKNKENQDTRNGSDEEELEELMTEYRTKSSGTNVNHDDAMLEDSSNNILRSNKSCRNSLATSDQAKFSKPAIHRRERDRSSSRRRIKKIEDECLPVKKSETESADDSENSSPNSVLDNIIDFPCDPEDAISGGVSMLRNSKTRRTLTEELDNYRKLNLVKGQNIALKSKTAAGKCFQLRRGTGNDQRYAEFSRMAEKETMESSWVVRSSKIQKLENYDDGEIISTELELKILDELVTELVVDLLLLHPGKFS